MHLTFFPAGCEQMWYVVSNRAINGYSNGRGILPVSGHGEDGHVTRQRGYMAETPAHDVTQLLRAWSEGDERALDKLIPLVYRELHRLAQRYMAHQRPGHTLQTTALVNEAYLRLVDAGKLNFQNRAHFFGVAAQMMRRILVDFARRQGSRKRGGEVQRVSLEESRVVYGERGADLVALDGALQALAAFDARRSRVVELRFFGGLSVEETAEVLRISPETVMRDWKVAKAWLLRAMGGEQRNEA